MSGTNGKAGMSSESDGDLGMTDREALKFLYALFVATYHKVNGKYRSRCGELRYLKGVRDTLDWVTEVMKNEMEKVDDN